jgi:hypothetical protein
MNINVNDETVAILIKVLYERKHNIHPKLIPIMVYYNVASAISQIEFMDFEKWVTENLEIAPKEAFNKIRINDCKENGFYIETEFGDNVIVALGDV